MRQPNGVPGTVSKIHWHFTGGPRWDMRKQCQHKSPKKAILAYEALVFQSKTLRLGQYHELVKTAYTIRRTDPATEKTRLEPREKTFESTPVCCLADIPIAHLSYHSHRYGKFAIGFHRESVVRHRFSPVFYGLHDSEPLQFLRRSISSAEEISDGAQDKALDVRLFEQSFVCEKGHPLEDTSEISDFESAFESIADSASAAREQLSQALAFVKTFSRAEFSTVYCEREWRSTREFNFEFADVAMIVLPRQVGGQTFYENFVKKRRPRLSRSIPTVAWEDLVEH